MSALLRALEPRLSAELEYPTPTPPVKLKRFTINFYSSTIDPKGLVEYQYRVDSIVMGKLFYCAQIQAASYEDAIAKILSNFTSVSVETMFSGWATHVREKELQWFGTLYAGQETASWFARLCGIFKS